MLTLNTMQINENFKYINEAEKCIDYMLDILYDTSTWWLDQVTEVEGDEYNKLHAEFMKTVLLMMSQD